MVIVTLKQALDSLTSDEYRLLMYAFEHDIPQWVKLEDGRYFGVNTERIPYLIPDLRMSRGNWAIGKILPR